MRLVSVSDAARYINLSRREMYNTIENRGIPYVKHGKRTMIDMKDLTAWIAENKSSKAPKAEDDKIVYRS